jgi:hypothetical protein
MVAASRTAVAGRGCSELVTIFGIALRRKRAISKKQLANSTAKADDSDLDCGDVP